MIRLNTFVECAQEGMDYYGGDIFKWRTGNAMQCANGCGKENYCKRWSWVKSRKLGKCILMTDANATLLPSNYCISGFQNSGTHICGEDGNHLDL